LGALPSNKKENKTKIWNLYLLLAIAKTSLKATTITAGMTKIIIAVRTFLTIALGIALEPTEVAISKDTPANKNGVASFEVTLSKPTIKPNTMRTIAMFSLIAPANKPTKTAIITPATKAHLPILSFISLKPPFDELSIKENSVFKDFHEKVVF